jgi:hypothetical protein
MEKTEYSMRTLGLDLPFIGPKNASDIANLTGDPRACEKAFMTIYGYQDRGPAVRANVADRVEKETGIERKRVPDLDDNGNQKKTKKGEPKWKSVEPEEPYLNRVVAEGALTQDDLNKIIREENEALGEYSFNPGRSSKPNKAFYETAQKLVDAVDGGKMTQERAIKNIEAQLKSAFDTTVGEFNLDNVARALELIDRRKKEEANALLLSDDEE